MKYRIKIITYKNGRKEYFPQFKTFFFWAGIDCNGLADGLKYYYSTREQALSNIDLHYAGNSKKKIIEFEYINK